MPSAIGRIAFPPLLGLDLKAMWRVALARLILVPKLQGNITTLARRSGKQHSIYMEGTEQYASLRNQSGQTFVVISSIEDDG